MSVGTFGELEQIRETLNKKGFIQTAEDDVICRFRYEDVKVDVMNTKAIGWAPSNPWFAPGFDGREQIEIDGQPIFIIPLSYFLATKFAAFGSRGKNEPRTSHDFEDIVYVMDNRIDLVEQILQADEVVKPFLKSEFESILYDRVKQEAVAANLFYESRDERFAMIMDKLNEIVNRL